MYPNTQTNKMIETNHWVAKPPTSTNVKELMMLGRRELWDIAFLGQAPMPEEAIRMGDWLIVPAHLDNSEIPDRAFERVQTIFSAGIRPKGFVLVHEAPMLLPSPETAIKDIPPTQWMLDPQATQQVIDSLSLGVSTLAKVMAGAVTAVITAGTLVIPTIFLAGVALLDPILIAVTEDAYWIEIDRWWV